MEAFIFIGIVLLIGVGIAFAFGVLEDARKMAAAGERVYFLSPFGWWFACAVAGIGAVALYWLMHHSSLAIQARRSAG